MDMLHAVLVAVIQGATELFPVSSLGHAVVLPAVLHWRIDQQGPDFLPFLVMLHVGTLVALLAFFWRDWWALFAGVLGFGSLHGVGESRRVLLLIVVATIPAVIVGGVAEHFLRHLFGAPVIAAGFLALNGVMLIVGERLRSMGHRPLSTLRVGDALAIGVWQCLALLPGMSRSGATMVGALLRGIDHEEAAHFSFLIAAPIIPGGDRAGGAEAAARRHRAGHAARGGAGRGGGRRGGVPVDLVPDAAVPPQRRLGADSVRLVLHRRRPRCGGVSGTCLRCRVPGRGWF